MPVARFNEIKEPLGVLLCKRRVSGVKEQKLIGFVMGIPTLIFHAVASARNRRNAIKGLHKENGEMVEDQNGMCDIAKHYFEDLFSAAQGNYDPVLEVVTPRISMQDNEALLAPFLEEEIRSTLFQMHPDKASGPDGLNPAFYKRF